MRRLSVRRASPLFFHTIRGRFHWRLGRSWEVAPARQVDGAAGIDSEALLDPQAEPAAASDAEHAPAEDVDAPEDVLPVGVQLQRPGDVQVVEEGGLCDEVLDGGPQH